MSDDIFGWRKGHEVGVENLEGEAASQSHATKLVWLGEPAVRLSDLPTTYNGPGGTPVLWC